MELNNREYFLIGIFLSLLIPLISGVLFWWSIASLAVFKILAVPERIIFIMAIAGLASGIVLDLLYLKKWIKNFYDMNSPVSILLYLFCSFMAVAFFMGIPIGNLFLGFLGGIYIGRKYHYRKSDLPPFVSASKNVSIFCAFVTSIEALGIGLLALRETSIIASINRSLDWAVLNENKIADIIMILILCSILFGIQYVITRFGTRLFFKKNL